MDTFMLLALDENDDIIFFTDKLSFDAREFEAGTYQFVLVHFFELSGLELNVGIDRLEGCFALSPYYEVEIMFQDMCSTSSLDATTANLEIYPNPTTDMLCIEADKAVNAAIFDLSGKEIIRHESVKCISTQNIAKGCYFILLENRQSKLMTRKKFVKL